MLLAELELVAALLVAGVVEAVPVAEFVPAEVAPVVPELEPSIKAWTVELNVPLMPDRLRNV